MSTQRPEGYLRCKKSCDFKDFVNAQWIFDILFTGVEFLFLGLSQESLVFDDEFKVIFEWLGSASAWLWIHSSDKLFISDRSKSNPDRLRIMVLISPNECRNFLSSRPSIFSEAIQMERRNTICYKLISSKWIFLYLDIYNT